MGTKPLVVGANQAMLTIKRKMGTGTSKTRSQSPFLKIAVIAVWGAAILVASAKEPDDIVQTARLRWLAKKNLRTMVVGLQNYADQFKGRMPPPALIDKNGQRLLSWRVLILPYVGHKALYEQFHLDEPWDSEYNKKLLPKMPAVFSSNLPGDKKTHETYYQAIVGPGAAFEEGKQLRFPADFSDGVSNTIGVVEAAKAVPWTKPEDLLYDPNKPLPQFGAVFNGDFHAAFLDGSVILISKKGDEKELRIIITRAGGEPAGSEKILADELNKREKQDEKKVARDKEKLREALVKTWKEVGEAKDKLAKLSAKAGANKASVQENTALMELLEHALNELDALQEQIKRIKK
jgi:hypothetical protein